jgi:hypothetical protein
MISVCSLDGWNILSVFSVKGLNMYMFSVFSVDGWNMFSVFSIGFITFSLCVQWMVGNYLCVFSEMLEHFLCLFN